MTRPRTFLLVFLGLLCTLAIGAYWFITESEESTFETSVSVAEAMTQDTSGFLRARAQRDFVFPEDHGAHPGYKNEWWYVTGNLEGQDGGRYGYELTIFRFSLTPLALPGASPASQAAESDWRTNQFYMAHFAVTDGVNGTFHAFERFGRGGAGLAGAQTNPFRVWLEDWSLSGDGTDSPFPLHLQAQDGEIGLRVTLRPEKPIVLQGNNGLSQKGPGSGNASYYYSYTRLATEGHLVSGTDTTTVTGQSWLDREWSTSALGPNQVGWDWFALQLDDGRDLMYYQLRNKDGSASRFSEGVVVDPDGSTQSIQRDDVSVTVLDRWTSPDGTHTYPVKWRVQIPAHNLDLEVVPVLQNQELDVAVRYWEGAVDVNGTTSGQGYVEMTGYGDSPASPVS